MCLFCLCCVVPCASPPLFFSLRPRRRWSRAPLCCTFTWASPPHSLSHLHTLLFLSSPPSTLANLLFSYSLTDLVPSAFCCATFANSLFAVSATTPLGPSKSPSHLQPPAFAYPLIYKRPTHSPPPVSLSTATYITPYSLCPALPYLFKTGTHFSAFYFISICWIPCCYPHRYLSLRRNGSRILLVATPSLHVLAQHLPLYKTSTLHLRIATWVTLERETTHVFTLRLYSTRMLTLLRTAAPCNQRPSPSSTPKSHHYTCYIRGSPPPALLLRGTEALIHGYRRGTVYRRPTLLPATSSLLRQLTAGPCCDPSLLQDTGPCRNSHRPKSQNRSSGYTKRTRAFSFETTSSTRSPCLRLLPRRAMPSAAPSDPLPPEAEMSMTSPCPRYRTSSILIHAAPQPPCFSMLKAPLSSAATTTR